MNTNHIVCVSCTKQKRDSAAPARDLYDQSNYFRLQREYATEVGTSWVILSAEHGVVYPNKVLEPYDTYLPNQSAEYQKEWANDVAECLRLHHPRKVTMLAGSAYIDDVVPALEAEGIEVLEPLRGLQFGDRLSKLNELIQRVKNESIV